MITTRDAASGPVVEVTGDLDHATAPQLRGQLAALTIQPGQRLVLDLGGLEFMDSSGISALIVARTLAHAAQAGISLAAVPANALRVLRIVGLDELFTLQPDAETAIASDGTDG
ncbi:STAS domain-containing protein [Streptomyces xanthochromogenes]|uniref:STAS domain-containing protein n=1 Tax=Streptomyces xanthochromogenes TaxID=67384 RepID=UPI00343A0DF9